MLFRYVRALRHFINIFAFLQDRRHRHIRHAVTPTFIAFEVTPPYFSRLRDMMLSGAMPRYTSCYFFDGCSAVEDGASLRCRLFTFHAYFADC